MADRSGLGDHPSHRCTADMGLAYPEGIKKPHRVVGHVLQCVGRAGLIEFCGEARIPVVEPDHIMAPAREISAEVIVPVNQLVCKTADQKKGSGRRVLERFVLDLYAIGRCLCQANTSRLST